MIESPISKSQGYFAKWIPAILAFIAAWIAALTPRAKELVDSYPFIMPCVIGLVAFLGVLAKSPVQVKSEVKSDAP